MNTGPIVPQIDIAETRRFLSILADGGPCTFQTFDDNASQHNRALAIIRHGELDQWYQDLERLNSKGAGIFVTVNETDLKGRKGTNIVRVRAVFLDLDGAPVAPVVEEARKAGVLPQIIVESSPGRFHCYWLVEPSFPLKLFKPVQKALAAKFNGDACVCDLPRVMRLPGFCHKKSSPFRTKIVELNDSPSYSFDEISQAFELKNEPENEMPMVGNSEIAIGNRHNTLVNLAVKDRTEGLSEAQIRSRLVALNENLDDPLPEREVEAIVDWVSSIEPNAIAFNLPAGGILLPSDQYPFNDAASDIFPRFALGRELFIRGGLVVELRKTNFGPALDVVSPDAFRSRIEKLGRTFRHVITKNGVEIRKKLLTLDSAKALLNTRQALEILPKIRAMSASPVLVIVDKSPVLLTSGYNPEAGGVLVTRDIEVECVALDEAVVAIKKLLGDFNFVSDSDKSRAIAALITPCLRIGGMIQGPIPVEVIEADKSQAGKGYFHKLIHAIYGESPYPVAKREGGVGSLDESLSSALLSGRMFISIDNLRGKLDSQFLEMMITWKGEVAVRVPHKGEVKVDASGVITQMTSNGVEVTEDLANRSSIVRIRKQPSGYQYEQYGESDLLAHVEANQGYYLGCVHTIVRHWIGKGMPLTKAVAHDLREWAGKMSWIVTNVFEECPLMEGHNSAKARVSNRDLVWLRELALVVLDVGDKDIGLSATALYEYCEEAGIDLPGGRQNPDDSQGVKMIGKIMGRLFRKVESEVIEVDDIFLHRIKAMEYCGVYRGDRERKYYVFSRDRTVRPDRINDRKRSRFSKSSGLSADSAEDDGAPF